MGVWHAHHPWDGAQLVAAACRQGRWELGQITLPTPADSACSDAPAPATACRWRPLALPFDDLAGIDAEAGRLVAVASSPTTLPGLLSVELASGSWRHQPAAAGPLPLRPEAISRPEPLWFEGHGGQPTHAWYYPPAGGGNPQAPLLVKGHSGPTGMARTGLNLAITVLQNDTFATAPLPVKRTLGSFAKLPRPLKRSLPPPNTAPWLRPCGIADGPTAIPQGGFT